MSNRNPVRINDPSRSSFFKDDSKIVLGTSVRLKSASALSFIRSYVLIVLPRRSTIISRSKAGSILLDHIDASTHSNSNVPFRAYCSFFVDVQRGSRLP